MKKYFLLLILSSFCFSQSLYSQNYRTNQKLLAEKENQLQSLQKEFSIDSVSFKSLIYGLEREIRSIENERDSIHQYLSSAVPINSAVGIFKKDISITNKVDKKDYYFDEGETVLLINHSHHTYTFQTDKGLQFTINRKYIKPMEGKKKTTSLIAQYQNKLEDYNELVASHPTKEWYQYDINRIRKEIDNYQSQYDQMFDEIEILKKEIIELKDILKMKTTI
ncbi:hypothetical protein [Flammeovirga sp. SJP92]|uniref:hypothetical protein n=1 Tax=Flammeovirga sp. SJP92 TaxID=1775430 RepID=UPI000787F228|nr:hypothetical protein [Flammeovirga sp. SJP92]KXX71645.1 hypothetical protein AVL50_05060 [Flammeovirga sp. SJP92]